MAHFDGLALLDRLELLVDPRSGVLRSLDRLDLPAGYEDLVHAFAAPLGRTTVLQHHAGRGTRQIGELAGYGIASDETTARLRAACEGVERYCSVLPPTGPVVVATSRELGDAALDPRRLPRCSARERTRACPAHRLRVFDPDVPEQWLTGHSVTRDRPVLVPATAVHVALPLPLSEHLTFPDSTGFAAGSDLWSATLAGLCEVVERDSVALWWLHQLPVPRVLPGPHLGAPLQGALDHIESAGLMSQFLDLTTDVGVPVVGLVQVSLATRPHVVVTAACRPDAHAAGLHAVEEAGLLRVSLASPRHVDRTDLVSPGGPRPAPDFGLAYADRAAVDRFAFALEAPTTMEYLPPPVRDPDPLVAIVARLAVLEMEVVVVDVTAPEIRDLGLVVVRVIVPELMRTSFAHDIRYLAHPRLYSAPARLGYGVRTEDTITDDPIPFA
ncbi:YcaO-like family protein [Streptomyces canus]|uniref:YcaO-like family protein n=1 Tax=Streptomyces canus TaxID=58343 RepID=UPI002E28703A|nr:YcaO-like family protein [Streptomyces canus]